MHHNWRNHSHGKTLGMQQSESVIAVGRPMALVGNNENPNAIYSTNKQGIGGGSIVSVTSKLT